MDNPLANVVPELGVMAKTLREVLEKSSSEFLGVKPQRPEITEQDSHKIDDENDDKEN
ncbi:MAG: hypothetical protein WAV51_00710 [Microgenomates group bacterium]